ncbi:hypothetical protein LOC54_00380 [Acetobacter sp. AN02]|uniref:hypothetical protein n=1 Tax=Acetobacter sp. AN02 TaxID=2894186 RepID=UPI00243440C0|nr:hypothetical protein [Acetobacter sp. AN02]MDG6093580.1 hypothetical protein [Acetobacter sp. AN02]
MSATPDITGTAQFIAASRSEKHTPERHRPDRGGIGSPLLPRNLLGGIMAVTFSVLAASALTVRESRAQNSGLSAHFVQASEIEQYIHRHGARAAAEALTKENEWSRLRRAVASGWGNWEKLVPELMPAVSVHTGESLLGALNTALPLNPHATLEAVPPSAREEYLARVCSPVHQPELWRHRTLRALSSMHPAHAEEQEKVSFCLKSLKEASET